MISENVSTPMSHDPLERFVADHHRRLVVASAIALDNVDLGLRAADHGLAWLAGRFDRHPSDDAAIGAAFDRGLAWARSPVRRLRQRLPLGDPDAEDPVLVRIADPVARDAYRQSSAAEREAAARSALLGHTAGSTGGLADQVAGIAAALEPPRTSLEAILDLGTSTRAAHRKAAAALVVVVVAMAGLSAVAVGALRGDRVITEVARPAGGGAAGSEVAELRLVWDTTSSPIGSAPGWAIDGETLYVLSTAPRNNVAAFQPALWSTTDGKNWSQRVLETSFNDGVTVFGGRIYVLSTAPEAPGPHPDFELRVDELAGSASRTLSLGPLAAGLDVGDLEVHTFNQNFIGAGAGGVIVSTVSEGYIDFFQMMPAEFRQGPFWPDPRPDGLHIIDDSASQDFGECMGRAMDEAMAEVAPLEEAAAESGDWRAVEEAMADLEQRAAEQCEQLQGDSRTAAVIPWADLGLEGFDGIDDEVLRSSATLHIDDPMADVPTITDITSELPDDAYLQQIRSVGDGFVAVAQSPFGGFRAGFSADGRKWVFGDADPNGWPMSSGSVNGTPTVLFAREGGISVLAFVAGEWGTIGEDGPEGPNQHAVAGGVGELGVVVVYEHFVETFGGEAEVFIEGDGPVTLEGPIDGLIPGLPGSTTDGPVQQFVVRYSADGSAWLPVLTTDPVPCCANPSVAAVGTDRITITIGSWNARQGSQVVLAELDR